MEAVGRNHARDQKIDDAEHITPEEQSDGEPKGLTREELIEQLDAQVSQFDRLPEHVKFSFATNADLYYPMLLILNIFKKGL